MHGEYDPHFHMREFIYGTITIRFDLNILSVYHNGKCILCDKIYDYIAFQPDPHIYYEIHEDIIKFIKYKRRDWARVIDPVIKERVLHSSGGVCNQCGSIENLEIDHIHPISKGGNSEENNLQVLCRRCNRTKYNKVI